jgi:hypothetical protein
VPAALIAGGVGGLAGLAAAPAIRYLYPELQNASNRKLGLAGAAATAIPAAGLAYVLSQARRNNLDQWSGGKSASYSPYGRAVPGMAAYGGAVDIDRIRKEYLLKATNPVLRRMPRAAGLTGQAFQNTALNAPGNNISQRQLSNQARSNGLFSAVGGYLNPVNRVGFALAGAGAQLMTNALGIGRQAERTLGMPVSQAARTYLPGAQMFARGIGMLGRER